MRSAASSAARRARRPAATWAGTSSRHWPSTTIRSKLSGAGLAERLLGGVEAEEDAGLLLDDPRARPRPGRDGRLGGDVAGADVLGERARDELGTERSRPSLAREDGERRGEPVQEVAPADRADLAGAEEAAGRDAERVLDRDRVVVGDVEHVRAAAVAGEQQRAGGAARRRAPRSAPRAPRAGPRRPRRSSRTCRRTVWPTRTRSPIATQPCSGSAPMIGRTRKSPRSYSGWFSSITMPSIRPCGGQLALARRRARAIASRRRSSAGVLASSSITLPWAAVIVISGADRRRALGDAGDTPTPADRARDRAAASTSPSRNSAAAAGGRRRWPGRRAPAGPGRSAFELARAAPRSRTCTGRRAGRAAPRREPPSGSPSTTPSSAGLGLRGGGSRSRRRAATPPRRPPRARPRSRGRRRRRRRRRSRSGCGASSLVDRGEDPLGVRRDAGRRRRRRRDRRGRRARGRGLARRLGERLDRVEALGDADGDR